MTCRALPFPFMSFRRMEIGMVPGYVGRVSFTGDLGFEIWVTSEYQRALYDLLVAAGREHGLKLFGGRALNAMRIEKSFGTWAREYRPIYGPFEAGLGRFVDFKKDAFIGCAAAAEEKDGGGALRLLGFQVAATDADAIGDEPIWHDGKPVGWVTSGAFGHRVGASLALGYVPAALAAADERIRDRDHRRASPGDSSRGRGVRSRRRADARLEGRRRRPRGRWIARSGILIRRSASMIRRAEGICWTHREAKHRLQRAH